VPCRAEFGFKLTPRVSNKIEGSQTGNPPQMRPQNSQKFSKAMTVISRTQAKLKKKFKKMDLLSKLVWVLVI
jgi:hypothetical protein